MSEAVVGAGTRAREHATLWTLELLPRVEFLRASYRDQRFAAHTWERLTLGTNLAGVAKIRVQGVEHTLAPGHLLFVNAGEVHTGRRIAGEVWAFRSIHFGPALLRHALPDWSAFTGLEPIFPQAVVFDPELAARFCEVHESTRTVSDPHEQRDLFLNLLTHLVTKYAVLEEPSTEVRSAATREVERFVLSNLEEPLRIQDLAAIVGLSRSHFTRKFRTESGISPHRFIVNCRVKRAMDLLVDGMAPEDVAGRVGFSDPSHLGRHFRRIVGVTPRTFAQAYAGQRRAGNAGRRSHQATSSATIGGPSES